eukprot:2739903-Prorocentrum_lima.AAC.1
MATARLLSARSLPFDYHHSLAATFAKAICKCWRLFGLLGCSIARMPYCLCAFNSAQIPGACLLCLLWVCVQGTNATGT